MSRRHPRQSVALFIGGHPHQEGEPPLPFGRTRDLSASGVYVVTPERPAVGELRRISLVWGADTFFCQARVIRHGSDGVALQFQQPDPSFRRALQEILDPPAAHIVPGTV